MPGWLVDLFGRYGYITVFAGVMLENAGVPVPGETVLLAGGALAHFGRLSLAAVVASAIAGATLGDNLGFLIGRHGGRRLIERHGPLVGLTPRRLEEFDLFFRRHGAKTVFIARFVTGLRVFGALLAGGSGLGWRTFLVWNAIGAAAWATLVGLAGYLLGHSWALLERWIGRAGLLGLVVAVAAAGIALARLRRELAP